MSATTQRVISRYASIDEALSPPFMAIARRLCAINSAFQLPDHYDLNVVRYPWAGEILTRPQFYGSRMWEYPWAVLESNITGGMTCADIGCGQSPFTLYLKELGCEVTGMDPVHTAEQGWYCHGVTDDFLRRTGIRYIQSEAQCLRCGAEQFDRVYCISVLEHIPLRRDRINAMREIARVLKPDGVALVTVDVNIQKRIVNPLDLLWESGLDLYGGMSLSMPRRRLGIFCDEKQPADVFGFALVKRSDLIHLDYEGAREITNGDVPRYRDRFPPEWGDELCRPAQERPFLRDVHDDLERNGVSSRSLAKVLLKYILRRYRRFHA